MTDLELRLADTFHRETLRRGRCAVCGYRGPHLQAHHMLGKGWLRHQLGRLVSADVLAAVIWDPRNGLAVCCEPAPNRCHERESLRVRPIPERCVGAAHVEFAVELDDRFGGLLGFRARPFSARLERQYGREVA